MASYWDFLKKVPFQSTYVNKATVTPRVQPTASRGTGSNGSYGIPGKEVLGTAADEARQIGDVTFEDIPAGGNVSGGTEVIPSMYNQYARAVDRQNNLLREQQEAMRKQREAQMNATIRANNQAADNSLKEAYIANMMSKRNLPQQLKALGIAGGASETTLADIDNTYMNNRFGIEANRNDANAQARLAYDNGVMGDYSDYLAKAYELQGGFADAIASGKLAGKTTTATSSTTTPAQAAKGYKVDSLGITATDEVDLYKKLMENGVSQAVAEQYLIQQGIIKPSSTGTPKR